MKPSWTEVASLALLLEFGLVMAKGWPPNVYIYTFAAVVAALALKKLLDVVLFWGYFVGRRKTGPIKLNQVRDFMRPHDNYNFAACRIGISHIRSAVTDIEGSKLRRKQWVKIFSSDSKQHIYRKVLGDPALASNQLELDYDSLLELGGSKYSVKTFAVCTFSLTPITTTHDLFMAHWRHPAEPYRMPIRIALIGLGLAVASIALSLISS